MRYFLAWNRRGRFVPEMESGPVAWEPDRFRWYGERDAAAIAQAWGAQGVFEPEDWSEALDVALVFQRPLLVAETLLGEAERHYRMV